MGPRFAIFFCVLLVTPSFASKPRAKTFSLPCDAVWTASVAVAKGKEYRIVSISKEDQVLSVAAGGWVSGERILSLSLSATPQGGCTAVVQSRFSGLAHSDAPDLLMRIEAQTLATKVGKDFADEWMKCMTDRPLIARARCNQVLASADGAVGAGAPRD